MTLALVEVDGVGRLGDERAGDLQQGRYRPAPARRVDIPKPDGRMRPLGSPTVRDRIVQPAAKLVLEPIVAADFLAVCDGDRPKRSATDALAAVGVAVPRGDRFVAAFDSGDFLGSIDHGRRMELVGRRVSDRRVRKRIRAWLQAGVLVEGRFQETVTGTPQGGVRSPLLANSYLHERDRAWAERGNGGRLVRSADGGVVGCKTRAQAEQALARVGELLAGLGLALQPDTTKVVARTEGREGFDVLGCPVHARVSGRGLERGIRRSWLHRWPSQRSMQRVRQRGKVLPGRSRCHTDVGEVIAELHPVVRGWGGYVRTGNAADKFTQLDRFVVGRLRGLLVGRSGRNLHAGRAEQWTREWLRGTAWIACEAPSAIRGLRNHVNKTIGKPYAGNPHVRIERGMGNQARPAGTAPLTTNDQRQLPERGRRRPVVTHLIGLLLGAEDDWPTAFEQYLRRLAPSVQYGGETHGVATERITIEPFDLQQPARHALVLDRLSYWYDHPREWLKKVALLNDVYLLNNPFTFQAMEKHN